MGKTNPTYRELHDQRVEELQRTYYRVLHHPGDQEAFDDLVEEMHLRRDAATEFNPRGPGESFATMLLNAVVGQRAELNRLRERVTELENSGAEE